MQSDIKTKNIAVTCFCVIIIIITRQTIIFVANILTKIRKIITNINYTFSRIKQNLSTVFNIYHLHAFLSLVKTASNQNDYQVTSLLPPLPARQVLATVDDTSFSSNSKARIGGPPRKHFVHVHIPPTE